VKSIHNVFAKDTIYNEVEVEVETALLLHKENSVNA